MRPFQPAGNQSGPGGQVTMQETAAFAPQAWEGFYVIVGSSAGALIGLQFVVLTLIGEAGIQLPRGSTDVLFIVGGAALLLVFIGIHNAWDTVTYVTLERAREHREKAAASRAAGRPPAPASPPAVAKDVVAPGPPPAPNP